MAVKCKITGKHKRAPLEKGGACPECLTPDVPVTGKGFVGAHTVALNLGEGPQIPVTDAGSYVGDPRDAAARREVEGIAVRKGDVPVARASADPVETTGHGRAPVLVRGRAMEPFAGEVSVFPVGTAEEERVPAEVRDERTGWAGVAGTMYGPTGRERSEAEAMVGGHYGYLARSQYDRLSRTQQRKYWEKIKKQRAYAARRRAEALARVPVPVGDAGAGSRFLEGSETERVMMTLPHA